MNTDVPVVADHLCVDIGCNLENLLGAIDEREREREREREERESGKSVLSVLFDDDKQTLKRE